MSESNSRTPVLIPPEELDNSPVKPTQGACGRATLGAFFRRRWSHSRLARGAALEVVKRRRWMTTTCIVGFLATNFLMFLRFFFPRVLFEPSTVFEIGYPSDFGFGVDTKFQKDHRIWVVHDPGRLFVIYARCTHLGCTPDWIAGEHKFKCPCHGSGYDSDGINFEGPAPRPMDRAKIELNAQGQIVIDTSTLYQWPKGQKSHFDDPGAYLSV